MKKCTKCQKMYPDDTKFCSVCGSELSPADAEIFCSKCGNKITANEKFCSKCGAPIAIPAKPTAPPTQIEPTAIHTTNTSNPAENTANFSTAAQAKQSKWETIKEKYFSFKGRLSRQSYCLRYCILHLTLLIFIFLANLILPDNITYDEFGLLTTEPGTTKLLVCGISILIAFVSIITLCVRRFHDLSKSGWFILLFFVPLINIFVNFYLLFFRGTAGSNKYGADPLQK